MIIFIYQYINKTINTREKNNFIKGYHFGKQAKLNRRNPSKQSVWQIKSAVHIEQPEHCEQPPPDK